MTNCFRGGSRNFTIGMVGDSVSKRNTRKTGEMQKGRKVLDLPTAHRVEKAHNTINGDPIDRYKLSEGKREAWKRASGRLTGLIPHGQDGETLSDYITRKRHEGK